MDSDDGEDDENIDGMEDGRDGDHLNQEDMKRELIIAIIDERNEKEILTRQNLELQKKIILSDQKTVDLLRKKYEEERRLNEAKKENGDKTQDKSSYKKEEREKEPELNLHKY